MRYLDKIVAIIGLFIGLFISLLPLFRSESGLIAIAFGITLFALCAIYLCLGLGNKPLNIPRLETRRSAYLLINILYFSIFAYSLISLHLRPDPYIRPLSYFVSIILLIGILTVEILFLPDNKSYSPFVLLKIILIPLSIEWSQMLMFPTVIGADSAFHQRFTQDMVATGFIPMGWGYLRFPIINLVIGITSSITELDYRIASMFSISTPQIICLLLFVFLLGKYVFESKVGLLAALLLGTSSSIISWIYWALPYTFAAALIPMIIYLLFKLKQNNAIISTLLAIIMMAILMLAHPLTGLCMLILLTVFWAGTGIVDKANEEKPSNIVELNIVILFIVGMLAWWIYVSGDFVHLVLMIKQSFSPEYLHGPRMVIPEMEQYVYQIPSGQLLFNNSAKFLFYAIALPGCFYMVSQKVKNIHAFNLAIGGMSILGIVFVGVIFYTIYEILSYRWEYFAHILLSVPLAASVYLLSIKIKPKFIRVSLVTLEVVVLSFLTIMSPLGNIDNPLFRDRAIPRQAYTVSELQAVETVLELASEDIVLDARAADMFPFEDLLHRITSIEENKAFYTKDFSDYRSSVIVIRKEVSQSSTPLMGSAIKLDYDPAQLLAKEGFSCIYTDGSTSAFYDTSNR